MSKRACRAGGSDPGTRAGRDHTRWVGAKLGVALEQQLGQHPGRVRVPDLEMDVGRRRLGLALVVARFDGLDAVAAVSVGPERRPR